MYVESSRIISNSKKVDDVKLWRETLDKVIFIGASCRPAGNQFGVIGIQIAGTDWYRHVQTRDSTFL